MNATLENSLRGSSAPFSLTKLRNRDREEREVYQSAPTYPYPITAHVTPTPNREKVDGIPSDRKPDKVKTEVLNFNSLVDLVF